MPAFINAEDFLNLRLGFQSKVLWRPAAEDEDCRLPAVLAYLVAATVNRAALCREDNRCRLVDIKLRIEGEVVSLQRFRGDVHADARIARR